MDVRAGKESLREVVHQLQRLACLLHAWQRMRPAHTAEQATELQRHWGSTAYQARLLFRRGVHGLHSSPASGSAPGQRRPLTAAGYSLEAPGAGSQALSGGASRPEAILLGVRNRTARQGQQGTARCPGQQLQPNAPAAGDRSATHGPTFFGTRVQPPSCALAAAATAATLLLGWESACSPGLSPHNRRWLHIHANRLAAAPLQHCAQSRVHQEQHTRRGLSARHAARVRAHRAVQCGQVFAHKLVGGQQQAGQGVKGARCEGAAPADLRCRPAVPAINQRSRADGRAPLQPGLPCNASSPTTVPVPPHCRWQA